MSLQLSIICKLIMKFVDLITTESMNAASVQISICCIHVLGENTNTSRLKEDILLISPLKFNLKCLHVADRPLSDY